MGEMTEERRTRETRRESRKNEKKITYSAERRQFNNFIDVGFSPF